MRYFLHFDITALEKGNIPEKASTVSANEAHSSAKA
jgi:hypothetical protein